ncbi:MAG: OmpA family protein [Rickettsiales bacterium]|nr:OmpA family protein [Rickettsiales bacterium]
MINFKKVSLLASVSAMLATAAFAGDTTFKEVVKDSTGDIVHSTNGNCVITRWDGNVDECRGGRGDIRSRLTIEQRTVYFDFNKSTLNAREKKKLDEVSQIIIESREVESVDIVGYADMIGKASYNKRLSTKRAQTVRSYLATKGLKTRNVNLRGLGETNSVTKCDETLPRQELINCLAADRRVEIELNVKQ